MKCREPILLLLQQILVLIPCVLYRYTEIKKDVYGIQFIYNDLFFVRLIVKNKSSYFKPKDIVFYALSEVKTSVYSSDIGAYTSELSSIELFRQMTFAAKRVFHCCYFDY